MPANLQIEQDLGSTAQPVEDANGNPSPLTLSTDKVGIGITQVGKDFEISGVTVVRASSDAGAAAMQLWAEAGGLGGLGTNAAYNPANPFSGWKHTIHMRGGNVGIGQIKDPREKLEVDGNILATGDIKVGGADCAEDFNVEEHELLDPGTVMVIGDEEELHQCTEAYDKRVAGVLSGAGDYRPGIVLDQRQSVNRRLPLGLTGKVFCKVDARFSPISVGDLLTTSPTPGHAMKADDPLKAFGAVIGKALRPLTEGQGLIPVLIALQ